MDNVLTFHKAAACGETMIQDIEQKEWERQVKAMRKYAKKVKKKHQPAGKHHG
jgi:hypothetical protein